LIGTTAVEAVGGPHINIRMGWKDGKDRADPEFLRVPSRKTNKFTIGSGSLIGNCHQQQHSIPIVCVCTEEPPPPSPPNTMEKTIQEVYKIQFCR